MPCEQRRAALRNFFRKKGDEKFGGVGKNIYLCTRKRKSAAG
jgi:hypothetical protein